MEPKSIIDVVAMTAESLQVGAITDFKRLIDSSPLLEALLVKPGLQKGPFKFKNGSVIRFRNLDGGEKARQGKRKYLFLNECNTVDYQAARQLAKRTTHQIFIDYNPDAEFWVHHEIIPRKDCFFSISNFTHNQFVPQGTIVDLYEDRQRWLDSIVYNEDGEVTEEDSYWKNQWDVYGLGLTGVVEGVIYKKVNYITGLPLGMQKRAFGLDFGFSNDPTALVLCGIIGNSVYGKELVYETGLTTPMIIEKFEEFGIRKNGVGYSGDLIVADSSNMDGIAQMQQAGYNVVPAKKPAGSVVSGINALQGRDIHITSDSKNWIIERSAYKYKQVNGQWLNEPHKSNDHCWDAFRYWYQYYYPPVARKTAKTVRKLRRVRMPINH